ncbi:hypothetical protein B9Z55_027887 [Caenorhabditis nigoni]|nr:hypothetical protein B9Z55_027887 [Caenorhabditis nigoni]
MYSRTSLKESRDSFAAVETHNKRDVQGSLPSNLLASTISPSRASCQDCKYRESRLRPFPVHYLNKGKFDIQRVSFCYDDKNK